MWALVIGGHSPYDNPHPYPSKRAIDIFGYRDGPVHGTTGSVNGHPNGVGMVQFSVQPEVIMTMPHLRVWNGPVLGTTGSDNDHTLSPVGVISCSYSWFFLSRSMKRDLVAPDGIFSQFSCLFRHHSCIRSYPDACSQP